MALNVYTNTMSITAQHNLGMSHNILSKSIERLSSGLRINGGADDASGMAISEKLRGQIKGMSRATMNAQDAISYLQTADGGLEVITDMLHRMHELSVQSGSAGYTANDRRELQKEMDQLKQEIDRVALSTEFNAQKLLSGDTSAVWSASTDEVEALMTGQPVAEGNYRLDFQVAPGQNAVYKTGVLLDTKAFDAGLRAAGAARASDPHVIINDPDGFFAALRDKHPLGEDLATFSADLNINIMAGDAPYVFDPNAVEVGQINGMTDARVMAYSYISKSDGTYENSSTNLPALFTTSDIGTFYGFTSGSVAITRTGNGTYTVESVGTEATETYVNTLTGFETTISVANPGASFGVTLGQNLGLTVNTSVLNTALANDGDTMVIHLASELVVNLSMIAPVVDVSYNNSAFGANNIAKFPAGMVGDFSDVTKYYGMEAIDGKVKKYVLENVPHSGVTISVPSVNQSQVLRNIKLEDLSAFTNADHRRVLDNTQVITIYGNDREVDIAIEGKDTLEDLMNKLGHAIVNGLDMGAKDVLPHDIAKLITAAGTGNFAVMGTIVLQTATVGKQSELKFTGDENVLNALGLAQIQAARENEMLVTVTNAHTGSVVGSDYVSDRMLRGIIDGVDVKIDSRVGLKANLDQSTGAMHFTANHGEVAFLHVATRQTNVQVGANEGAQLDISVARVDSKALEIDDAYLMTREDAQKALTKVDQALTRVIRIRSGIGAQVNRMENAMRNMAVGRQNLTAAESRIRDLDVAEESATFAKSQVLVNAAVAMLAQANQQPQTAMQLIGGR